jgi:D-proline reductase (dithiol) PrdB
MTEANNTNVNDPQKSPQPDPREAGAQLRPGLWHTINARYPGSMITKDTYVPLAPLTKPLDQARLVMISSCGVHRKIDRPLDVCHPFGDFGFRRVPSNATPAELTIHQLKYPHDDADIDINVAFPIERLQELVAEGTLGGLTSNFFSFIGYNMDPDRFERTVARDIAEAVAMEEKADLALLVPA